MFLINEWGKPQEINKKETLTTLSTFIKLHKQIIDKTNQKHNCPRKAKTKHNSKSKEKKQQISTTLSPCIIFQQAIIAIDFLIL